MINHESQSNSEPVRSTLKAILAAAGARKLKDKDLAQLAGLRPETLSRMKSRGTADFNLIDRLARVVGLKLAVVPDNDQLERIQQGRFFT
ncbi:MAG: helix-turn-helix domain-containing protein [Pseudomonadota bacterium]